MSDADIPLVYQQDLAVKRSEVMAIHDFAHVLAIMYARSTPGHIQAMPTAHLRKSYETLRRHADALSKDLQSMGWPVG